MKKLPRYPTEEMQKAMVLAMFDLDHSDGKWRDFLKMARKGWQAAYDAAPLDLQELSRTSEPMPR